MILKEKWVRAQQHEKDYFDLGKNKQWQTPHSLGYWLKFLQTDKLNGIGLEIGCGPNGLYNFTEQVIGIDSINYHKKNFINCVGELLPFKSKSFDFVICCNSLDHCKDPQLVINEIFRLSDKVIIWTNLFLPITSFILGKVDSTHPFHFTSMDLKNLFSNTYCKKTVKKTIISWHGKNATWKGKFILFCASLLGVSGVCLHLEAKK